jgi:predicted amidohydrolase
VKIAIGQMRVEPGKPQANISRAMAMIANADRAGCDAIVLPECLDVGWTHPSGMELAQAIPGPITDKLAEQARTSGIIVAAGLVERDGELLYNAAVLMGADGEILLKHRKINELPVGRCYARGRLVNVVDSPLGTVGLAICADLLPESIHIDHTLAAMGAKLILSPCAWAMPADHDNEVEPYGALWRSSYTQLAAKGVTTIAASNVGPITAGDWAGRECIGASLAIGPNVDVQAPYGVDAETMLIVDVP